MKRLAIIIALLTVLASTGALLASPAGAEPQAIHVHFNVDETFDDVVCGIPVTIHIEGFTNVILFSSPTGHGDFLDTSEIVVTNTNPETGKSVNLTFPGRGSGTAVENPDGTTTFTFVRAGADVFFGSTRGDILVQDVGRFILQTVVDLNDPENPDDDVVVSQSVLFEAGPHPQLGDEELFCEVMTAALT